MERNRGDGRMPDPSVSLVTDDPSWRDAATIVPARVSEPVDDGALKALAPEGACGFESHPGHGALPYDLLLRAFPG
jgi:hypothetical protein